MGIASILRSHLGGGESHREEMASEDQGVPGARRVQENAIQDDKGTEKSSKVCEN